MITAQTSTITFLQRQLTQYSTHVFIGTFTNAPVPVVSMYSNITGSLVYDVNAPFAAYNSPLVLPTVYVGGNIDISVAAFTVISFPLLQVVAGGFNIHALSVITAITAPLLTTVGSLDIDDDAQLNMITLPSLSIILGCGAACNTIALVNNAVLTWVALPSLTSLSSVANILICENARTFVIPETISNVWGGRQCYAYNGSATQCSWTSFTACP